MRGMSSSSEDIVDTHEMERAAEQKIGPDWIKPEAALDGARRQLTGPKGFLPFLNREVVVRQDDSVRRISHEIHETQRRSRQPSLDGVILDDYALAGNTDRVFEHCN